MPCPRCESASYLDDYRREFCLTRYHVDIGQQSNLTVSDDLETTVEVDGRQYRIEPLVDEDPTQVENTVQEIQRDERFKNIVEAIPENLPQEYNEEAYLSRHLTEPQRSTVVRIADDHDTAPRLILLLGFVESVNRSLGRSDDTLTQYIRSRDSVADHLAEMDGQMTPRLEREFVAHLLLATALIEELTAEALFREIYREEHRLSENEMRVNDLTQGQRMSILESSGIISEDLKDDLNETKQLRNDLVHNPRRRTGLARRDEGEWVGERLKEIDQAVTGALNITGKAAARLIAENGPAEYLSSRCDAAIETTTQHWKQHHRESFEVISDSDVVTVEQLRWNISIGSAGYRNVTHGVRFEQLPNDDARATDDQHELYETTMEFLRSCESFLLHRIEADLDQANLDRQDFTVLCLLCAEDNSYQDVADTLGSTVEYVQRKENVLAWRSSTFEKEAFGQLPTPEGMILPSHES